MRVPFPVGSAGPIFTRYLILIAGLLFCQFHASALIYTVINTNDSGAGSLRQAIQDANSNPGADSIIFQILGTAPFTITPTLPLPALSGPVDINATTQLGYTGQPLVELNFASAGSTLAGLQLSGGNSSIRGLAVNRVNGPGIWLNSSSNILQANYVGTDVTGTIVRGSTQAGVFVTQNYNVIGGTNAADRNLISGGNLYGIYVLNGGGNLIQGNYIGVNAAGTTDLGNVNNGVVIYDTDISTFSTNIIGGVAPGAGNVISGNDASGIYLFGPGATSTVIRGNFIGLNALGTGAISNSADGITIDGAPANQIGGTIPGARNVISGNGQAGIYLSGTGASANRIEGNYIGTDAGGTIAAGNHFAGITLSGAVSNSVGGSVLAARNMVSGNYSDGLFLTNATGNSVQGNYIGLSSTGAVLGNAVTGITLDNAPANSIGGSPGEGNVISGNANIGVWLHNPLTAGNSVRGNLIGTDPSGTTGSGNNGSGVGITDASSNVIGGSNVGDRNVISGNGFPATAGGIFVLGSAATGNKFFGNYIGTDVSGQNAMPNRYEGFYISGSRSNVIGSELPGAGNLVSGNTTRGIYLLNSSCNVIAGNLLGTKADGVSPLGNGQFNVELETGCYTNMVGGTAPGAGNRIAYTGLYMGGPFAGVRVRTQATDNAILGNSCFNNSGFGISFSGLSVTPNDSCDTDSGGNNLQNFPELSQAVSGLTTGVRGAMPSRANTAFRLQFFASAACDGGGNGEGQIYLGEKFVTTSASCMTSFVANLSVPVPPGYVITATATDPANNTSEFSSCIPVVASPRLIIDDPSASQISLAWTNSATGFVLKETTNLSPPVVWTTVTNNPANSGGQFVVTLTRQPGNRFYLLSFE